MDFEEIVEQHVDTLFRLAYTYVKNKELAEDIVQDVFIKAYERQHQFRAEANYKTYLIKMTINRSYDMLRSWQYRNIVVTNIINNLLKTDNSPESFALSSSDKASLAKLVFKLKPKYRETIYLYYYCDFDVKEIATLLHISVNTVKTRLVRARKQLEIILGEEEVMLNETDFN